MLILKFEKEHIGPLNDNKNISTDESMFNEKKMNDLSS